MVTDPVGREKLLGRALHVANLAWGNEAGAFVREIATRPCVREFHVRNAPPCGRCDPCRARELTGDA